MEKEFIEVIFEAIARINFEQPMELVKEPEDDEGADEARENAAAQNEDIEKNNSALEKLKTFVKLVTPTEEEPEVTDYKEFDEKCYIRLKNYREPPILVDGAQASIDTNAEKGATITNTNQSIDRSSNIEGVGKS